MIISKLRWAYITAGAERLAIALRAMELAVAEVQSAAADLAELISEPVTVTVPAPQLEGQDELELGLPD